MLNYTEAQMPASILAKHYAKQLNKDVFTRFILGYADISTPDEAQEVCKLFWEMTDIAIEDNESSKEIEGISDIEFWMHKVYQKVSGYMVNQGYSQIWESSHAER